MDLKPAPTTNTCPTCGKDDPFLLAQDFTSYSKASCLPDGRWEVTHSGDEAAEGEYAVRLYCTGCGEYFHIPEELK